MSAACIGVWLIVNLFIEWQRSSTILHRAYSRGHIWDLTFPAITICPQLKIQNKSVLDYTKEMRCKAFMLGRDDKLKCNLSEYRSKKIYTKKLI